LKLFGANSERAKLMPKLTGTPKKRAIADVTRVPHMSGNAPKEGGILGFAGNGCQVVPHKKLIPYVLIDNHEFWIIL
jgi:hypothetical protein